MLNVYGSGAHIIAYPVSPTHASWAITLPETAEASETWRLYGPEEQKALSAKLSSQFASCSTPVPELVASAERLTKFGLFDRNELEPDQWHTRRCVLVGDAAHPTSPHLGQGANQALYESSFLARSFGHNPR
jgi:salicylate hydroxylase